MSQGALALALSPPMPLLFRVCPLLRGESSIVEEHPSPQPLHRLSTPPQLEVGGLPTLDLNGLTLSRHYARMAQDSLRSSTSFTCRWLSPEDVKFIGGKPIAAGGFTDIWEATHDSRRVVLKSYRYYVTFDLAQVIARFHNEANVCGFLTHRDVGVVSFVGVYSTEAHPFGLVYEYMDGLDLKQYLRNEPNVGRLKLLTDIARCLNRLHDLGIVHGDLQTANILVDKDGTIRIAGLGNAYVLPHSTAWTAEGGTRTDRLSRSCAPELARPGMLSNVPDSTHPTKASDMYAFGVITFEVLTGRPPFYGMIEIAAAYSMLNGNRPPRPDHREVSDRVWYMIERCWNRGEVVTVKREPLVLPLTDGANQQPVSPPNSQSLLSTSSTHRVDVGIDPPQCPAWNDGYCPEGRHCKMLHIHPAVRWRMEAEQEAAKTTNRLIFGNTKVVFGAGCEIKEVTTALESCRVLISNLPAGTTREALEDFITRAGFNHEAFHILVLRMSADQETQEASVTFNDPRHAKTVVEVLDKEEYFDEVLRFELAPAVTPDQMDDWTYNRSSYLEVTFNAPSMRVQAIYPTVEDAIEKAKALNGGYCGGRTVRVTVASPREKHETWTYIKNSIIISNVAIDTPDSEIHHFANPFSIKRFSLRRFKVDTALQKLKDHMQTIGGLKPDDFDVTQNHRKGTILVRGRFDTWEQADRVWQSLQETELEFLARDHAQIFLAFPYQYSLHVPLEHYDAQKEIYDSLQSQHGHDRTAHVVATRHETVGLIQVVGIDKKAVGALKLKVEKIAQGEVVEVWDKFFLNWQGNTFFDQLLRRFKAYVRPDSSRQILRVYGSEAAVNHAQREIKEQMRTLAALDYQMTIEDRCVGFFIRRGMKVLSDMLGEDNVWLNTTSKPHFVSVRGGHDAEHALQKLMSEALKKPLRPSYLDRSQSCPLCFGEPSQPFPLACRHIYCTGCLNHMLISATDGKSAPICCIADEGRCKTQIPLPVIERFISPVRLTQMFENSFRVYLEQHSNEYGFCPTPDCTQIYRVPKEDSAVIQCPACLQT
ncbi:hypothetical protein BDM02DRAFT_3186563 [Thelephora ganbajun]|uniref:Uncharacterized protein n=1 Tax=Thelephora ganbajun TaxID=370292 RepID=A0ACB6ZHU9_THEGA|nr:hypothetical protein BDM02DRAFT_3186563 [Thelephora ganbajun]